MKKKISRLQLVWIIILTCAVGLTNLSSSSLQDSRDDHTDKVYSHKDVLIIMIVIFLSMPIILKITPGISIAILSGICYGVEFLRFAGVEISAMTFTLSELTSLCLYTITTRWSRGRCLSFSLAIVQSASLLSPVVLKFVYGAVSKVSASKDTTIFLSTLLMRFLCFLAAIIYGFFEHSLLEKMKPRDLQRARGSTEIEGRLIFDEADLEYSKVKEKRVRNLKTISKLTSMYWIIAIGFAVCSQVFDIFDSYLDYILIFKYSFPRAEVGNLQNLKIFSSLIFLPMVSILVVLIGKKGFFMLTSSVIQLCCYMVIKGLDPGSYNSEAIPLVLGSYEMARSMYLASILSSMVLNVPQGMSLQAFFCSCLIKIAFNSFQISDFVLTVSDVLTLTLIFAVLGLAINCIILKVSGKMLNFPENHQRVVDWRRKEDEKFTNSLMASYADLTGNTINCGEKAHQGKLGEPEIRAENESSSFNYIGVTKKQMKSHQ